MASMHGYITDWSSYEEMNLDPIPKTGVVLSFDNGYYPNRKGGEENKNDFPSYPQDAYSQGSEVIKGYFTTDLNTNNHETPRGSIYNMMKKNKYLSRFTETIDQLQLRQFFQASNPSAHENGLTVFAPINSNFELFDRCAFDMGCSHITTNLDGRYSNVLDRKNNLIKYHVVNVPIYPEQLFNRIYRINTILKGNQLISDGFERTTNTRKGSMNLSVTDAKRTVKILDVVEATNGFIYITEYPLTPHTFDFIDINQ